MNMKKAEREKKKELILEALEETMGMITTSCERAGVSRVSFEKWRKDDPEFDGKVNAIKAKQKEFVEGQLMTAIRNGNVAAMMFFLKTQAGWRETQKIEVSETSQIDVAAALREMRDEMMKKEDK